MERNAAQAAIAMMITGPTATKFTSPDRAAATNGMTRMPIGGTARRASAEEVGDDLAEPQRCEHRPYQCRVRVHSGETGRARGGRHQRRAATDGARLRDGVFVNLPAAELRPGVVIMVG